MGKKIVVACDSFKGCLSSLQVADACGRGILSVMPSCEVVKVAIADGGEGTASALVRAMNARMVSCQVHDPLMRPLSASYGLSADGLTAVIEMASAAGLALLSPAERNPLVASTFGVGEMIADACARGCRRFLIGIGGSATCDGGMGMMQALGVRFLDASGTVIAPGSGRLDSVRSVDRSGLLPCLRGASFSVACDVSAPLFGPSGSARVFAPQKGASPADVELLDSALRNLASVAGSELGRSLSDEPGAGAAGGLGWALSAFLGASLVPGIDLVLDAVGFSDMIKGAHLVITGEGCLDSQTLMGKAPSGVLAVARREGVPVLAIGGKVDDEQLLVEAGFCAVRCINAPGTPLETAMRPDYASERIAMTVASALCPSEQ